VWVALVVGRIFLYVDLMSLYLSGFSRETELIGYVYVCRKTSLKRIGSHDCEGLARLTSPGQAQGRVAV